MQKLGFGTGVNVYLMKRFPRGLSHSPWVVKKINPRCNDVYQSMYLKRLTDEAKYFKSLNHPNIIAFTEAGDGCLCLAMEYGGEKSLNDLIEIEIEQSYPTLCDPMDGSPPGSAVHGIFRARILEWAAISFSKLNRRTK